MQPPQNKTDALRAIPVPRSDVSTQTTPTGLIRITYPETLAPWLTRLLPKGLRQPLRTIELDVMGSYVWNLMDGNRTVRDLTQMVSSRYSCLPQESEQAVAAFVRQLGQKGILVLR